MDRSERIGLGVSAGSHVLIIAALALGLLHWSAPKVLAPPSLEVSLTDNIALQSRATSNEAPQQAQASELGVSEPDAVPGKTAAKPEPKPEPKVDKKAEQAKLEKEKAAQTRTDLSKAMQNLAAADKAKPRRASLLGDDFLKGIDSSKTGTSTAATGDAPLSPQAARALNAEINRQIKPYWNPPTGADADQLKTVVVVNLAQDGSIVGQPRIKSQTGVTASNASQKSLHAENALRALRRAAPFKLPADLYSAWQSLEISFDKRLSQ